MGLRRGREALRDARTDPGEDGDGVREYCELVLHLLSTDATATVRDDVATQDVKLIEQLMETDGRREI